MANLAYKNLFHDRIRLAVTLSGIVFALVLIIIQFGLFLGFMDTTANIIEHSRADLWVAAPGTPHVNGGTPIPERRRYQILAQPGVAQAEKYLVWFVNWKLPSGATESAQVVGFDVDSGIGGPWNLVAGSVDGLRGQDTVILDELFLGKLGVKGIGDTVEINGRRARVVGLTRGIRSFTTAPWIFTSFKNAQNYAQVREEDTLFFLVKLAPGADPTRTKAAIEANVPWVEVKTNPEMRWKTQYYWLFSTGAGITTLMGAALGLLVGVVVVAQTIYATTMDHIREYGTLKAMGAANSYLYKVIIQQALIAAAIGYALALATGALVVRSSATSDAAILLPPEMVAGTLLIAIFMCVTASLISIRKATGIDPALVFKG
ncbi:MAG: ABC transporter permease [Bryobacteraceae bacterium]